MKAIVLSDTHIPKAASDLPKIIYEKIGKCDLVIHAGDFTEIELLERLRSLKETLAVCGNMDSREIRAVLKEKEVFSIDGFKIGLTHGSGHPKDLLDKVKSEFGKVDAIIFGHSHVPTNLVEKGVLFFNPGSPTDKVFSAFNSYGILMIEKGGIKGEIVKI